MGFHFDWLDTNKCNVRINTINWYNKEIEAEVQVGDLIKDFKRLKDKDEKGEQLTDAEEEKMDFLSKYVEYVEIIDEKEEE